MIAEVEPMKSAMRQHVARALGMRRDQRLRMLGASFDQPARRERRVHDAGALPDLHVLAAGLLLHVVARD